MSRDTMIWGTTNQPPNRDQPTDVLIRYLREVVADPGRATLDMKSLPPDFRDLARELRRFGERFAEARVFANALAAGDLAAPPPSAGNELADPLMKLHSSLSHLTWQAQQVALGDYSQRMGFMGEFSTAFNDMIERLAKRQGALESSRLEAERANRAKSAFLATISHEVRTPLNAIIGLSEIELRNELPESLRGDLEKIHNAGVCLLEIINDLLDISKIEAGRLELVTVPYQVAALVNDAVQLNLVRIGSKRIGFFLEMEETLPATLHGDDLRISQILNNLLSNAIKYTREGRVGLRVGWEWAADNEAWLVFTVSDTGIGIKEEDIERIFSEYRKFDAKSNRAIEGTGLGLSITKKLAELMGGTIGIRSTYGKGSEFVVRLRQGVPGYAPIGKAMVHSLQALQSSHHRRSTRIISITRAALTGKRVLVVDDNAINLVVAKGQLGLYNLTVDCVRSGREAVGRIRAAEVLYDAVFMDHMMPEMDGMETVRVIRNEIGSEYARSIPIIALTADAVAGNKEMFLNNGFNDFLSKPIDSGQLDAVLNKWVREQEAVL